MNNHNNFSPLLQPSGPALVKLLLGLQTSGFVCETKSIIDVSISSDGQPKAVCTIYLDDKNIVFYNEFDWIDTIVSKFKRFIESTNDGWHINHLPAGK